jgi:hypothetical protein
MKKTLFVSIAVLALVMGVVAYAAAAGTTVTVTAKVNPLLQITVADGDEAISFDVTPGQPAYSDTATVNVRSNVAYDVQRSASGDDIIGTLGMTVTGATGTNFAKAPSAAGMDHTDTFEIDNSSSDWLDPTATDLVETFTYSVVPN